MTRNGSTVVELIRPEQQGSRHLSLALATVAPGQCTRRHRHRRSEEVYYILTGEGELERGGQRLLLKAGEAALIKPGEEHCIRCCSGEPVRMLCCCAPPYQHEDTEITEGDGRE